MTITSDLAAFYDWEAKKYHQTRKKYRSEAGFLLNRLHTLKFSKPKIFEFGCGGGRFLNLLKQEYKNFSYKGVDISQGLLDCAQKDHPEQNFVCKDMVSASQELEQESLDIVIWCASFQHLSTEKARLALMKNAYRALKYGGVLMMTNWSLSERVLSKYWKSFLLSFLRCSVSLGKKSWRDALIPWKTKNTVQYRYYHFFVLDELKSLAERAGFVVEELVFLDIQWVPTAHWRKSKNSFLFARKKVFQDK